MTFAVVDGIKTSKAGCWSVRCIKKSLPVDDLDWKPFVETTLLQLFNMYKITINETSTGLYKI